MNMSLQIETTAVPVPDLSRNSTSDSFASAPSPSTLIISSEYENSSLISEGSPTESIYFILVPLLVIFCVAITSGLAIYCIQSGRRRRADNLRHSLIPMYTYNRDDDEWGVLLRNYSSSFQ